MPTSSFSNAVVLVTGAASGIGRELALQAATQGAAVIAADINAQGLADTRQLIEQQQGLINTFVLDIGDKAAIDQFASQVIPRLNGRRLILINNAGTALLSGTFGETDVADIEWLFSVNFWGAVRLTKAFYPYFLARNEGHIVNLSSVFGLGGFPLQSAYSTSKFALRGFTETIRVELMGTGVGTTCVHPGGINTNIARNSRVANGDGFNASTVGRAVCVAGPNTARKSRPPDFASGRNQKTTACSLVPMPGSSTCCCGYFRLGIRG